MSIMKIMLDNKQRARECRSNRTANYRCLQRIFLARLLANFVEIKFISSSHVATTDSFFSRHFFFFLFCRVSARSTNYRTTCFLLWFFISSLRPLEAGNLKNSCSRMFSLVNPSEKSKFPISWRYRFASASFILTPLSANKPCFPRLSRFLDAITRGGIRGNGNASGRRCVERYQAEPALPW